MSSRQVYLYTTDISKYVIDINSVTQNSGEYGQLTVNDIPSMRGNNITGFWDSNNPSCPFYGITDFSGFTITIVVDSVTVYTGGILTIDASNDTLEATITLRSALQTALERGLIYVTEATGGETPAEAIANICNEYSIPYDSGSFAYASSIYQLNEIYITVEAIDPFARVMDVFQSIIDIGVAKLYSLSGVLYYQVYEVPTATPLITFTDDQSQKVNLYAHPVVTFVLKDQVNGYRIEVVDPNGPATFGLSQEQSKTISAGADAPVKILALQSGIWIGDQWLSYLNRPQKRIEFGIPTPLGKSLPLNSAVTIVYTQRNWLPIIVDLTEIDNSTRVISRLVGLTR